MSVHFEGILVALFSYVIIGIFHPVVIKCEYYFSSRIWPVFLVCGILLLAGALFTAGMLSIVLSLLGASFLWCIHELKEQEERVAKGWFPQNPERRADDKKLQRAQHHTDRSEN